MGGLIAVGACVGVVFLKGEEGGREELDDDVAGSVFEEVIVAVSLLPSPSMWLVYFAVVLLDRIGSTTKRICFDCSLV